MDITCDVSSLTRMENHQNCEEEAMQSENIENDQNMLNKSDDQDEQEKLCTNTSKVLGKNNECEIESQLPSLIDRENQNNALNSQDDLTNEDGTLLIELNEPKVLRNTEISVENEVTENDMDTGRVVRMETSDLDEDDSENFRLKSKNRSRILANFDSESEDEGETKILEGCENMYENPESLNMLVDNEQPKKMKRIAIIDSESDGESSELISREDNSEKEIFVMDKNGKLLSENQVNLEQKNNLLNICDPESSDESHDESNRGEDISDSELDNLQNNEVLPTKKGKRKNVIKEEKMTAKKALEERKEILAESQRRFRDSNISLPYHKPRPRSLKEFLQNRPKLALSLDGIPQGRSPVTAIKMSSEQLKIVSCKLKEREKELKEFYKSESESDDENDGEQTVLDETVENMEKNEGDMEVVEESHNLHGCMEEKISVEENNEKDISDNHPKPEPNATKDDTINSEIVGKYILDDSENYEHSKNSMKDLEECPDSAVEKHSQNDVLEEMNDANSESEDNEDCCSISGELARIKDNIESQNDEFDGGSENNQNGKLKILSNVVIVPAEVENSDTIAESSESKDKSKEFADSYEFNLDDLEDDCEDDKKEGEKLGQSKSELLERLVNIEPRLSGAPNHFIDLENDDVIPDEVCKLRERFMQHNLKIRKHDHKTEISVLSVSNGEIHKETVAFNIHEDDEENTAPLEKPGVRLKKLRDSLQHQMAQRRSELWKEKLEKVKVNEEERDENKKDEIDDILDMEDEEELTESEEEDELEEDDYDITEKVKKKSDFIEEEADESDVEEMDEGGVEINEMNEEMPETEGDDERDENEADVVPKTKVLKRILKPFGNDESDDEDEDGVSRENNLYELLGKKRINENELGDEILPAKEHVNYRIREPMVMTENPDSDFLTPVTYMTGLKNLNTSGTRFSDVKNVTHTEDKSEEEISRDNPESQICSSDSIGIGTQDVLAICSGQFPSTSNTVSSPEISTQHLQDIFGSTSTQISKSNNDFDTQDLGEICSGQFTGITLDIKEKEKDSVLDEKDEHMISQLIDEEELERFKKKFESPLASCTQRPDGSNEIEEVKGTGGVIDSDEDDEELTLKKKKRKKLDFSDEESEEDGIEEEEEIVDLQDDEDPPSDVEYDSEENEVDTNQEERKKQLVKATEFFENEAELSESEWGSEDEDEKNLDEMEMEKGDEEKFDDDELRTDIERIQMRQMLDEDNREVKLLQELLLEDGELHGSGRQRQFKWKNIGAADDNTEETKIDEDEIYLEDNEETEEQWRKSRYEREQFLMKKRSQTDEDTIISESQRLSFSKKPLKVISQTVMFSENDSETVEKTTEVKKSSSFLNKRGSFLSRSELILSKLTETSKVSLMTKSTNRIVFHAVDELNDKKRKASLSTETSTPVALKKMRLSGFSPAVENKKSKIGKSLFGDIRLE